MKVTLNLEAPVAVTGHIASIEATINSFTPRFGDARYTVYPEYSQGYPDDHATGRWVAHLPGSKGEELTLTFTDRTYIEAFCRSMMASLGIREQTGIRHECEPIGALLGDKDRASVMLSLRILRDLAEEIEGLGDEQREAYLNRLADVGILCWSTDELLDHADSLDLMDTENRLKYAKQIRLLR